MGKLATGVPQRHGLIGTAAFSMAIVLGGCGSGDGRVLAGLPGDFASQPPAGPAVPPNPPAVTGFDGYYQGDLAVAGPACPRAPVPQPIPRDMLVLDGNVVFGVNLPFRGTVAPDGTVALHDGEFGTLAGQFAAAGFRGTLDAGPGCRWLVRLHRTGEPPQPDAVQPQPVDTQPPTGPAAVGPTGPQPGPLPTRPPTLDRLRGLTGDRGIPPP